MLELLSGGGQEAVDGGLGDAGVGGDVADGPALGEGVVDEVELLLPGGVGGQEDELQLAGLA